MLTLPVTSGLIGLSGGITLFFPSIALLRSSRFLLAITVLLFPAGFVLPGWFYYRIYQDLPLDLPSFLFDSFGRKQE